MLNYTFYKTRLHIVLYLVRSLSFLKILNLLQNLFSYLFRLKSAGGIASVVTFQLCYECNLSCIMCQKSSRDKNDYNSNLTHMDFERIKEFIRAYHKKLIVIRLTGGEPLFYKQFEQLIDLFNAYKIKFTLLTNGTLLTESIMRKMIPNCVEISISMDSIHETTYSQIRRGGNLQVVVENIRRLNEMKQKRKAPILNVAMTCFSFNIDELSDLVKFCNTYHIPTLSAGEGTFYNTPEIKEEHFIKNNRDQVFRAVNKAQKTADELGITLRLNAPILYYAKEENRVISNRDPVTGCTDYYIYCIITPEFEVKLCPASDTVLQLDKSNLLTFWNSPSLKTNRKVLEEGRFPQTCRYCTDYNLNLGCGNDYSFVSYQKRTKYWKIDNS